jgi:hypothetical protein
MTPLVPALTLTLALLAATLILAAALPAASTLTLPRPLARSNLTQPQTRLPRRACDPPAEPRA